MRIKAYIFVVLVLALFVMPIAAQAKEQSAQSREYKIKAAFLYNFIKFVDWPKEKIPDSNEPITIGIVGKNPFGKDFEAIEGKRVKGKKLAIKYFPGIEQYKAEHKDTYEDEYKAKYKDALRKCHLLFISSSESKHFKEIINLVKDGNVLTVGQMNGLLKAGGIINFVIESKKVRFEINLDAAEKAKLKMSSKLLRLAKRVIKEKPADEVEK